MSLAIGALAFGGGVWLLVESVEGLVKTIRAWATAIGISGMLLSALVHGLDVESTAAGVAATLDDLPGTALGTSIGAAIFLLTAGLGIAGLVAPFAVWTPPALLVAAGAGSALAIGLSADGTLSRIDGVLLALAFPPLVAVMLRTRQAPAPAAQGERPDRLVLRIGGGLVGLVVGAELLVFGTGRMVEQLGLSEAVFGLLVPTLSSGKPR